MLIVLLHPHEHAGRQYAAGDTLELPADSAVRLVGLGRAEQAITPIGEAVPGVAPISRTPAPRRDSLKGK